MNIKLNGSRRANRARGFVVTAAISVAILGAAANAELIFGVTEQDILVSWDSSSPGTIIAGTAITGLAMNERIQSIDFRATTGQMYAIGTQSNLYTINVTTGAATEVNGGANNPFNPQLNGSNFGFDFNPLADLARITSNADQNLRVDPNTGAVVGVDSALAYANGDPNFGANPNVTHSAYTNNFPGAPTTQLYGIDAGLDVLVLQNPPNSGTLTTIGSLGVNIAEDGGFDVSGLTGLAYAALRPVGMSVSHLYLINLNTGLATDLGEIGGGVNIRAMTIAPIPGPGALLAAAVGLMAFRFRRRLA